MNKMACSWNFCAGASIVSTSFFVYNTEGGAAMVSSTFLPSENVFHCEAKFRNSIALVWSVDS